MEVGKAVVLSQVLKMDRPFKAATIFQMADLSRSLVRYHLDRMQTDGLLAKNGMYYSIISKAILIDEVVNVARVEPRERKISKTKILNEELAKGLNEILDLIVVARLLKTPLATEIQRYMVEQIDQTVNELRNAKKYLRTKEFSDKKQHDKMRGEELSFYLSFSNIIDPIMPKDEFVEETQRIVNDY